MGKHAEVLTLVDDGLITAEYALELALMWLGEHEINNMVNSQPDWGGLGIADDEKDEDEEEEKEGKEVIDGLQYRYVVVNPLPHNFVARIYTIEADGSDSAVPVYEVDDIFYAIEEENLDFDSAESIIDYFLEANKLPYADHYLLNAEDVIYTTK